jgi:hypothetical protein
MKSKDKKMQAQIHRRTQEEEKGNTLKIGYQKA